MGISPLSRLKRIFGKKAKPAAAATKNKNKNTNNNTNRRTTNAAQVSAVAWKIPTSYSPALTPKMIQNKVNASTAHQKYPEFKNHTAQQIRNLNYNNAQKFRTAVMRNGSANQRQVAAPIAPTARQYEALRSKLQTLESENTRLASAVQECNVRLVNAAFDGCSSCNAATKKKGYKYY